MKILDRYIVRMFLLNFVILFLVITGLILLINLIVNFDRFVQATSEVGGNPLLRVWRMAVLATDFYGPQVFLYYHYMVGLLPVGAAAFTLAQLVRTHELTAMLAGGVAMLRIAMPILVMGFAANVLMVLNQELALPNLADKIQRRHADIEHGRMQDLSVRLMPDSYGSLYIADGFEVEQETLRNVVILVREPVDGVRFGRGSQRITADRAVWDEQRDGWRLINGRAVQREPLQSAEIDAALAGEEGEEMEVQRAEAVDFIRSDLDPVSIVQRERQRFRQLLSTRQLDELIERSALLDPRELRRIRHSRFSLVVTNMLILAMGLSFFLLRSPANMMLQTVKAAPLCVGAWGGAFVMMQMGFGWLPPVVVAWLPVAIYTPVAIYLIDAIES